MNPRAVLISALCAAVAIVCTFFLLRGESDERGTAASAHAEPDSEAASTAPARLALPDVPEQKAPRRTEVERPPREKPEKPTERVAIEPVVAAEEPAAPETEPVVRVPGLSTFGGVVRLHTKRIPKQRTFDLDRHTWSVGCDPEKIDRTDRKLLVHEEGGIANVVVEVDLQAWGRTLQPGDVPRFTELLSQVDWTAEFGVSRLTNARCNFEPHVLALSRDTTLRFYNQDAHLSSFRTRAKKNRRRRIELAPQQHDDELVERPEVFEVESDLHPWADAWVYVAASPYFAVTDERGRFKIDNLPPGPHKVRLWHEHLGKREEVVTLLPDQEAEVDYRYPLKRR